MDHLEDGMVIVAGLGPITKEEYQAFQQWCRDDPEYKLEYDEICEQQRKFPGMNVATTAALASLHQRQVSDWKKFKEMILQCRSHIRPKPYENIQDSRKSR